MRKRIFVPVMAAAMLAVPMLAAAQEQAAPRGERMPLQRFAAELNLTDDQQSQLRAIREELRAQNEPLIAQLREAGVAFRGPRMAPEQRERTRERAERATPEQREQMRERMRQRAERMTPEQREQMRARMGERRTQQVPDELKPVVQQIRENSRAAMERSRAVLTAEQQAQLRTLMQEHRQARGPMLRRQR